MLELEKEETDKYFVNPEKFWLLIKIKNLIYIFQWGPFMKNNSHIKRSEFEGLCKEVIEVASVALNFTSVFRQLDTRNVGLTKNQTVNSLHLRNEFCSNVLRQALSTLRLNWTKKTRDLAPKAKVLRCRHHHAPGGGGWPIIGGWHASWGWHSSCCSWNHWSSNTNSCLFQRQRSDQRASVLKLGPVYRQPESQLRRSPECVTGGGGLIHASFGHVCPKFTQHWTPWWKSMVLCPSMPVLLEITLFQYDNHLQRKF